MKSSRSDLRGEVKLRFPAKWNLPNFYVLNSTKQCDWCAHRHVFPSKLHVNGFRKFISLRIGRFRPSLIALLTLGKPAYSHFNELLSFRCLISRSISSNNLIQGHKINNGPWKCFRTLQTVHMITDTLKRDTGAIKNVSFIQHPSV